MAPTLQLKAGARNSPLSMVQSRNALARMASLLPDLQINLVPFASPGDEDRKTDLRVSDPDFFTRYLDEHVLSGDLDCAIHSAKDLPEPLADGLDWFWLPWREDPRDAVVLRAGESDADLPDHPVIGVSSDRRESYCRDRWPNGIQKSIRGNIEHRLEQLDRGDYDVVIIAGAALNRLDLKDRITEWIPLRDLQVPDGQGYLAVTFREGDKRFWRLRNLLIHTVTLVSAGRGHPGLCTVAGMEALRQCDVCLYDALISPDFLKECPPHAKTIFVGKRHKTYSVGRLELDRLLTEFAKQGKRVVRLKGGDSGIFARLQQETEALAEYGLPFRVLPGVTSMLAATTSTGLMLTRKGICRGFTVVTPEQLVPDDPSVGFDDRTDLPLVFFMASKKLLGVIKDLIIDGRPQEQSAAVIFGASTPEETIITGTLSTIAKLTAEYEGDAPGLLVVGEVASNANLFNKQHFALEGKRVLLTCSEAIMPKAEQAVYDLGGVPVAFPLIKLDADPVTAADTLQNLESFQWMVITSPSAVKSLTECLQTLKIDIRELPPIITCGAGTADALRDIGLFPKVVPSSAFSGKAMLEKAGKVIAEGDRVLRLRSDLAGTATSEALETLGAEVVDCLLYRNTPVAHDALPPFDAIFFGSGSAVNSFVEQFGVDAIQNIPTVAIGEPTKKVMASHSLTPSVIAHEATAEASIQSLAAFFTMKALTE